MKGLAFCAAILFLVGNLFGQGQQPSPADPALYGPYPTNYKEIVMKWLEDQLIDVGSARIAIPLDPSAADVDQLILEPFHHDFLVVGGIRTIERRVCRRRLLALAEKIADQKQYRGAKRKPFHRPLFFIGGLVSPAESDLASPRLFLEKFDDERRYRWRIKLAQTDE